MAILDLFKRSSEKKSVYVDGYKEEIAGLANWVKECDCDSYKTYGYRTLASSPEIKSGIEKIAEIISSMTIYLKQNTPNGDVRIKDGLSKFLDIEPSKKMNRQLLISWIVQEMLIYGNALVIPHTKSGYFYELEPIDHSEYQIIDDNRDVDKNRTYYIQINKSRKVYIPDEVLHFRYNPNLKKPRIGQGQEIILRDLMDGLGQARRTVHDFLENQILPTIIIRVDALPGDLKTSEGRDNVEKRFLTRLKTGQPWIVPSMMDVEKVEPLTLNDVGINERLELDRKTVASVLGIPSFLLGVGNFNKEEYNNFIRTKIAVICKAIEQELTRKLLLADDRYFTFNQKSMLSYDLDSLGDMYMALFEHGIVTGNEVRDVIGMSPIKGLDELLILENYIPVNKSADQKKLKDSKEGKNKDEDENDSDNKESDKNESNEESLNKNKGGDKDE